MGRTRFSAKIVTQREVREERARLPISSMEYSPGGMIPDAHGCGLFGRASLIPQQNQASVSSLRIVRLGTPLMGLLLDSTHTSAKKCLLQLPHQQREPTTVLTVHPQAWSSTVPSSRSGPVLHLRPWLMVLGRVDNSFLGVSKYQVLRFVA